MSEDLVCKAKFLDSMSSIGVEGNGDEANGVHELVHPKALHLEVLVATMLILAAIMILTLMFHYAWTRIAKNMERNTNKITEIDELSKTLLNAFVSSVAVDSYEFKGMMKVDQGIAIGFDNLGLELKSDGRSVLDGVTGFFPKGNMVAIMGPSGCGKTTFMNTLCGKATYGDITGEVKINGEEGSISSLKPIMGFVPQDDVVHEKLTVAEQIQFSAELRNDVATTRLQVENIVKDVLQVLQIRHIQTSVVGGVEERGISGGQRKRVNIGLELAACPVLLFLDEPTSGLDSTSSLMIINSLKKMTDLGMTIIMVIHQPRYSLFTLFDQVLLLGKGGRTVYLGPSAQAMAYFEEQGFTRPPNENPADWLMDVISGEVTNDRMDGFKWDMLFGMWDENVKKRGLPAERVMQSKSSEKIAFEEQSRARRDMEILKRCLEDEWQKLDVDGNGNMDEEELAKFMNGLSPKQTVEGTAIHELFVRIKQNSTENQNPNENVVTRAELEDYLLMKAEQVRKGLDVEASHSLGISNLGGESTPLVIRENGLERVAPGMFRQTKTIVHRCLVQFWRTGKRRLIDQAMIIGCSCCVALKADGKVAEESSMVIHDMALAMLMCVSGLSIFADRAMISREASSNISLNGLFCGRVVVHLPDWLMNTFVYVITYWVVNYWSHWEDAADFRLFLYPALLVSWVATSWGYFLAMVLPASSATIAAVILMTLLCGILGSPDLVANSLIQQTAMQKVIMISITRWSIPMFFNGWVWFGGGIPTTKPPACSEILGKSDSEVKEIMMQKVSLDATYDRMEWLLNAFADESPVARMLGYLTASAVALSLQAVLLMIASLAILKWRHRD